MYRIIAGLIAAMTVSVIGQDPDCSSEVVSNASEEIISFVMQKDTKGLFMECKFPPLLEQEALAMILVKSDIQYKKDKMYYCKADLDLEGVNYCYMGVNTCFVVSSSKKAFNHPRIWPNCSATVFIPAGNVTLKSKHRVEKEASFNIAYRTFSLPSEQEKSSTIPTPTRLISTFPSVTKNQNCSSGTSGTEDGTVVPISVVLGILSLLLAIFLTVVLSRASQKGVLAVIFGGKSTDGGGNSGIQQDGNDGALYSIVQEHSGRQNAQESSERQVVVNELYSMT